MTEEPLRENASSDDLVERARALAERAHAGQHYGEGSFAANHLERVVATLRRFGESDPLLVAAAWLHDVIEDTPTTREDIEKEFGPELSELVWRLTDESGGSRRERQTKTHAKIRADQRAVRVKLADRIANVEAAFEQKSPLRGMYRKEYPLFREHLHRDDENAPQWRHLDRLLAYRPE